MVTVVGEYMELQTSSELKREIPQKSQRAMRYEGCWRSYRASDQFLRLLFCQETMFFIYQCRAQLVARFFGASDFVQFQSPDMCLYIETFLGLCCDDRRRAGPVSS